ncbi:PTPLA-domain-containing protein [Epithele typhae]|uniref:PTPLA-domain-containing protein n=1 Tax=Epithele typhae TaxID=378194 RepID=UPI002007EB42|nr:PTPLA-domain-containing protein [Epithele typhae]KAH9942432.1 PTPLA-domain-containing protein [Epithele typhae]
MAFVEEVDVPPPVPRKAPAKRGLAPALKAYLVLYNVLSALGWAYLLARTAALVLGLDGAAAPPPSVPTGPLQQRLQAALPPALAAAVRRSQGAHAAVGWATTVVQSAALLEVAHVVLRWVRSPLLTTLMQVSSRLYLVWGVTYFFPLTHTNPLYASMVLSWSLTEVVRYSFYACALLGTEPRALVALRYTLFYVLYPTGASSEALLIGATLPPRLAGADPHALARFALFLIWWPGLYVMYTHMMRQRRKVFSGGPKTKQA